MLLQVLADISGTQVLPHNVLVSVQVDSILLLLLMVMVVQLAAVPMCFIQLLIVLSQEVTSVTAVLLSFVLPLTVLISGAQVQPPSALLFQAVEPIRLLLLMQMDVLQAAVRL